ncbi:IFT172 [Bugula neritina]|uniref:IFT172 n=1 Tax=Bugula neritina TaxID=10212 RepID=A0A7J7KTA8_BUGNE|nr:IFT172 [Bugula neritina]
MWQDVLRVAKEYLPNKLPQLQDEYERDMMDRSTRGAETLIQQAKEWESSGEHLRAIECYVKVNQQQTNDQNVMYKCWMKACQLAVKFLPPEKAVQVIQHVAPC